jgi:hypothetical protein
MIPFNEYLLTKQKKMNNFLEKVINIEGIESTTSLDHQNKISLISVFKITKEDALLIFSLHTIHNYFFLNLQTIEESFEEKDPPVSLPFSDIDEVKKYLKILKKIIQDLGPPYKIDINSYGENLKDIKSLKKNNDDLNKKKRFSFW